MQARYAYVLMPAQ